MCQHLHICTIQGISTSQVTTWRSKTTQRSKSHSNARWNRRCDLRPPVSNWRTQSGKASPQISITMDPFLSLGIGLCAPQWEVCFVLASDNCTIPTQAFLISNKIDNFQNWIKLRGDMDKAWGAGSPGTGPPMSPGAPRELGRASSTKTPMSVSAASDTVYTVCCGNPVKYRESTSSRISDHRGSQGTLRISPTAFGINNNPLKGGGVKKIDRTDTVLRIIYKGEQV